MNALLLVHGLLEGGTEGARATLAKFWNALGHSVPWDAWGLVTGDGSQLSAPAQWMLRWAQSMSPAQANPMRMNPLRDLLARSVDFERLRSQTRIRVAHRGHACQQRPPARVRQPRVVARRGVASACLPSLHHAVEIDGEPYWDGGFSANPPVMPLLRTPGTLDVMVVMLSPWRLGDTPSSADSIRERTMEIAFNATFLGEMRLVAEATELAQHAWWPGTFERRLKRAHWHLIDGGEHLATLPSSSKLIAHSALLQRLHDAGPCARAQLAAGPRRIDRTAQHARPDRCLRQPPSTDGVTGCRPAPTGDEGGRSALLQSPARGPSARAHRKRHATSPPCPPPCRKTPRRAPPAPSTPRSTRWPASTWRAGVATACCSRE
jgi:NTE family protein